MKTLHKSKSHALAVTMLCLLMSTGAGAQMLIQPDGRVTLGRNTRPMDDPQNVLTLTLQGPYGEYNSGAKLGFGDFGRQVNNGWNVFIGEWGNHDSDML